MSKCQIPGTLKSRSICFAKVFALTLVFTVFLYADAFAQRGNQSDWNVPPPLAPGNITKGTTEGRSGNSGTATLTIVDAAPVSLPGAAAQALDIAPISTTAPQVSAPQQPEIAGAGAVSPADMPVPASPEAPPLPELTLKDATVPALVDIPLPQPPELPPPPAQPTPGPATNLVNTGTIPLTPAVADQISFAAPTGVADIWSTPDLPGTINFKLIINGK